MFTDVGFIIICFVNLTLYTPSYSLGTGSDSLKIVLSSGTLSSSPTTISVAIPGAVSLYTSTDTRLDVPSKYSKTGSVYILAPSESMKSICNSTPSRINGEVSIKKELLPCGILSGISVIIICFDLSFSSIKTSISSRSNNLLYFFTIAIFYPFN